jgi:hypothetical protein
MLSHHSKSKGEQVLAVVAPQQLIAKMFNPGVGVWTVLDASMVSDQGPWLLLQLPSFTWQTYFAAILLH